VCRSQARHRGHLLYYRDELDLFSQEGRLLYFAPESGILPHLQRASGLQIETTDRGEIPGTDHQYDIQDIDVGEGTFDFVICHRVIEHVVDDRKAIRELHRILRPGGLAIVSVPIVWDRRETIAYGKPNPLCSFHCYEYGVDFRERITAGFDVTERDFSDLFDAATWRRLALHRDCVFECRKPIQPDVS